MKRNIKLVLVLELVLLIVVFWVIGLITSEDMNLYWTSLIDVCSFAGILLITIPGLFIMGKWKDFRRAFSVGKKKYSLLELKGIVESVSVCQKLVVYGGLIELLILLIVILGELADLSSMGPKLSFVIILALYVVVFEFFLLPLRSNAVQAMNEEMDIDVEE